MQHSVWNMFTAIRNGFMSHRKSICHQKNSLCVQVLKVFYREGFVNGFKVVDNRLEVYLKYTSGKPVIKDIKSLSKPGRRFYISASALWKIKSSLYILILSTSRGVLSDKDCRKYNVGGEVLCVVF